MRIGEAARRAGVNTETLRYYERRGLLPQPDRGIGGHREYSEETVRFVSAVKQAQSLGFSLSEIEDFLRVARRNPDGAAEAIRRRLEEKLREVEGEIAELRSTHAGLARALDEVWASVPSSTSTAAYLARAGRHPDLLPGEALHVTDGESVASTLRRTSLGGVALSWQDVLHEGPLDAGSPDALRQARAEFLSDLGWGETTAIAEEMRRRDELFARAVEDGHPIVLWFEHDLFDQLQLAQILARLPSEPAGAVELVQTDDYLGPLDATALEELSPSRRTVTPEMIELGRAAWEAVRTNELEAFLQRDSSALPHLAQALRRLQEEREELARTDRQLLEALRNGPATPLALFAASQAREEAIFLGDSWCFLRLYELWERGLVEPVGGGRLPLPPPRGDRETFTVVQLRLTPAGRKLV